MLTPQMLEKLLLLFEMKNWDIDEDPNMPFERFSANLARLEEADQNFILEVTEKYNVYRLAHYEDMLNDCLVKLNQLAYFKDKSITICPLLPYVEKIKKIEDKVIRYNSGEKRVKSSNLVCYLFKSNQISYRDYLRDIKIEVLNYLEEQDILKLKTGERTLLLVDDYIGSGKTAEDTVKSYLELGIPLKNITILSLLVDEYGKRYLENLGYDIVYSNFENHTIKNDDGNVDDETYVQIERIARKLKVARSYRFGYANTMGLVSLVRTPNNTLPFYWFERKERGWYAPFPRYEERKSE